MRLGLICIIPVFCCSVLMSRAQAVGAGKTAAPVHAWRIEKETSITINGKSNFSPISCQNRAYRQCDTLYMVPAASQDSIRLKGRLFMDIIDFNCHNYFFTGSLRRTLRSDQYPNMVIRFLRMDHIPLPLSAGDHCQVRGLVEISLAGVSRIFDVPVQFLMQNGGRAVLSGSRLFHLQDFDLKGPPKMVGLLRVKNEFVVEFSMGITRL